MAVEIGVPVVEFRLLGRVEASCGGEPLDLGRRRERSLLALLLLELGFVTSTDRLLDLLWDGDPPARGRADLHTHVSRLRTRVDPGGGGRHGFRIRTRDGGYVMAGEPDMVDAHRFRRLVFTAVRMSDPAARAGTLREALRLWRGPVLADSASDLLRRRVAAELTELRTTALELAIEYELACGRHDQLVGELTRLTIEHPERERLRFLLMLSLYRAGRQSEALRTFAEARRWSIEELGVEPGPGLHKLHQDILNADRDLDSPTSVYEARFSQHVEETYDRPTIGYSA